MEPSHNVRLDRGGNGAEENRTGRGDGEGGAVVNMFPGFSPDGGREFSVNGGAMNEEAAAVFEKIQREAREAGRRVPSRITVYLLDRLGADGRTAEAAILAPFVSVGTRPQNRAERARAAASEAETPGREFAAARYRFLGEKIAAAVRRDRRGDRARRVARADGGKVELSVSVPAEVRGALELMAADLGIPPNQVAALLLGTFAHLSGAEALAAMASARRGNPERFLRAV